MFKTKKSIERTQSKMQALQTIESMLFAEILNSRIVCSTVNDALLWGNFLKMIDSLADLNEISAAQL